MAFGDKIKTFEGAYNTNITITINRGIPEIALELDSYANGVLTEHTYFDRDTAIEFAKAILEELQ